MSPVRREGDQKVWIESWGSHVDRQIREAQERGDFDNLPGAGKPLRLEENVFGAEWQSAFRMAKNAGAAPLWVELDREIGVDAAALQAMLERTARRLATEAARIRQAAGVPAPASDGAPDPSAAVGQPLAADRGRRWPFGRRRSPRPAHPSEPVSQPRSLAELEAERLRARALYLGKAGELDQKIQDYNAHKPRTLSWLEKPRLLPAAAARQFDAACPPLC
jgi:hypothetical protein